MLFIKSVHVSKWTKNICVGFQGQRNEYELIDFQKAKDDAMRLYEAGEIPFTRGWLDKLPVNKSYSTIPGEARFIGIDESTFTSILASHSWGYLRQIMEEYELLKGHSLETAVANEFSFDAAKGLLAIRKRRIAYLYGWQSLIINSWTMTTHVVQCAQNRPAYFARKLNNAMKGIRTDEYGHYYPMTFWMRCELIIKFFAVAVWFV